MEQTYLKLKYFPSLVGGSVSAAPSSRRGSDGASNGRPKLCCQLILIWSVPQSSLETENGRYLYNKHNNTHDSNGFRKKDHWLTQTYVPMFSWEPSSTLAQWWHRSNTVRGNENTPWLDWKLCLTTQPTTKKSTPLSEQHIGSWTTYKRQIGSCT